MEKTLNVYWAHATSPANSVSTSLLMGNIAPVISTLVSKHKPNAYHQCKSFHAAFKNMFLITHPVDLEIDLSAESLLDLQEETFFVNGQIRYRPFKDFNKTTFDYDHSFVFFSEESLILQVTPAYMHNTSDKKSGYITSGSMDISSWYRPIFSTYQLWDNQNSIKFTKDEPMMYFQFLTDKKINLIRFEENDALRDIRQGCVNFKHILPNQPLGELYRRFRSGRLHKKVLKEIKKNIL